jgi:hypothetical protein
MIVCLVSHFNPNLTSAEAKEGLIVVVVCQERTQTQGITLKAPKTKAETPHRPHKIRGEVGRSPQAWSVSREFVPKTKAKNILFPHKICGGAGRPLQSQTVSRAFIHSQQEETKKGAV